MDITVLVILSGVGVIAGFVDAVAGGGGLIALPALLSTGLPPIAALATNKMQGAMGTGVAAFTYWREGLVKFRQIGWAVVATFIGAYLGALVVKSIDTSLLNSLVPVALIAIAIYFIFAPKLTDTDKLARLNIVVFAPLMGFVIGFYDGVFGPGTGSFFTIAFVSLFGLGIVRASANTKMLNFTSNIAALALFIPAGNVVWSAAIAMGIGQMLGGYVGAKTGIKYGAKFIKPLVVIVCVVMAGRLLLLR